MAKYRKQSGKKMSNFKKLFFLLPALVIMIVLPAFFLKNSLDNRGRASIGTFSTITSTSQVGYLNKSLLLSSLGQYTSQYSPYLLSNKSWGSELMYYCKNTPINGVYRDRVWRAEIKDGRVVDNRVVIEGRDNHPTDLSCSPGVVIARDGTWHMYYITADRSKPTQTYIYHATASAPGVNWKVVGAISGMFSFPYQILEIPSPILTSSGVNLFVIGAGNRLMRAHSTDFHNFAQAAVVDAPKFSVGRVVRNSLDSKLYYVYGSTVDAYTPPHEIRLAYSPDGTKFVDVGFLFKKSNNSDWDSDLVQTPFPVFYDSYLRVYYSGVKTVPGAHFTANSAIGYRTFMYKPTGENYVSLNPETYWSSLWGDSVIAVKPEVKADLEKNGWRKIGNLRWMADRQIQGTTAVYQLWSDYVKDHFYTTSVQEKDEFIRAGWADRGIIGYLYSQSATGRLPIYRAACGPWTDPKAHYFLYSLNNSFPTNCKNYGILGYTK